MDIDISSVHELWAAPKENWLDLFVNPAKLKKLLNEESKSDVQKEEMRRLVIQFAEQASQVESETDTLIKKQFGPDDVTFHRRKSTCLWLCSLGCLAAIEWDFESLVIKTEDIIVINSIFDRIELWKEYLSSPSSVPFSTFLISRWRLFIFSRFRIPPPEAKQTVSNPCTQHDAAIQRFDHARMVMYKLREHVDSSHITLESILNEGKEMRVPLPHCFIQPFIQEGALSLSIGILGENVLSREESLLPRLPSGDQKDTVVIPAGAVAQKILLELSSSFFCSLKMVKSVGIFKQLLKSLPPSGLAVHSLVRVDEGRVNGMAAAFKMTPPYVNAIASTSREHVNGQITSNEACPQRIPQKKYGVRRDRMTEGRARSMNVPPSSIRFHLLSLCDDLWNGGTVGWRTKMKGANDEKRRQTVERLCVLCVPSPSIISLSPQRRAIAKGTARFVAASLPNTQMDLQQLFLDCLRLPLATVSVSDVMRVNATTPPPSASSIRAMAASDKPLWTLLTSFDADELQAAFRLEGSAYTRPAMIRFPQILGDLLVNQRQVNELHALMLGKLQQLTDMGDIGRWQKTLNEFVPHFEWTTQAQMEMSIYEAARTTTVVLNRQLFNPHSIVQQWQVGQSKNLSRNLKKLALISALVTPMVTVLLNLGEFVFLYKEFGPTVQNNIVLNVGKVLAVIANDGTASDPNSNQERADAVKAFHILISHHFEAVASKRRHDGFTTMHLKETGRLRVELMRMFENIKTIKIQSFLISYFAHLYTQALAARGRAHLRIYIERIYVELFAGMSLNVAHTDSLDEMLSLLLNSALSIFPYSPTFLRIKADFAYVRNQLSEAGIVYCELVMAVKSSLAMPFPVTNDVIDESVWSHLRICLRKKNQQTLAACVCQLFETGRAKEFRKAAEAVQERYCLDASDDCFGLIYDVQLAEALTDAYRKRGQQHKLEAVLDVLASPAMNPNNGKEIVEKEIRRKQKKLLNTLAAIHFGIHN